MNIDNAIAYLEDEVESNFNNIGSHYPRSIDEPGLYQRIFHLTQSIWALEEIKELREFKNERQQRQGDDPSDDPSDEPDAPRKTAQPQYQGFDELLALLLGDKYVPRRGDDEK